MNKKTRDAISEEEVRVFRDAMQDVKPWKPLDIQTALPQSVAPSKKISIQTPVIDKPVVSSVDVKTVRGDEVIEFHHTGLQRKKRIQLRRGKLAVSATLDLHGLTVDAALQATHDFIVRSQRRHFKTVCIIHGKGRDNQPVLKNMLNHYLRSHAAVVAFTSAPQNLGGTGSVIVLLRS